MIGRTNASGGRLADAFAVIAVTYPVGSTCTCTNGTKTLKAKDTSGSYLFMIPEAGAWTVTATDGTSTVSRTVNISAKWQGENVALSYRFVLFENCTFDSIAGGCKYTSTSTQTEEDGSLKLAISGGVAAFSTNNIIDLANYQKLYFRLKVANNSSSTGLRFGVSNNDKMTGAILDWNDDRFTAFVKITSNVADYTDYVVPISDISEGYIQLGGYVNTWLNKIWLE